MNLPKTDRVGWIGSGVMGRPMMLNLIKAGYTVSVFSRRHESATEIIAAGGKWCGSIADLMTDCDIICSMVGYPADVRQVYLEPGGIIEHLRSGQTCIDFTTSDAQLAVEIADAAAARGAASIDAPVSGGDIGARNAALSIMVGGDEAAFENIRHILETLGKHVVRQGGPGSGQRVKATNQILVAIGMIGVCEALTFAMAAGLDAERVLPSISSGAAGSWSLSNLAPRILQDDLQPGFYVDHLVKDLGLVLEECRRLDLRLPGLELAADLYRKLQAAGHGRLGTQALIQLYQP